MKPMPEAPRWTSHQFHRRRRVGRELGDLFEYRFATPVTVKQERVRDAAILAAEVGGANS